jgi:hypothetical protein
MKEEHMTTALQIVNRAAELIGYKDPSEALDGNDSANFLAVLNDLVGTWNTDRLYVVATTTVSASVSASPVSIGTGQTLSTPRPIRIESAWVRVNGVDYPLSLIGQFEYDAIPAKATTSTVPNEAFYSPGVPYGSLYLYPVPSAAVTLFVRVMAQLSEFANLATEYDLAPGYKRALEYSLAEELAPGRRGLDPQIARHAQNARKAIRRANYEPVQIGSYGFASGAGFNVLTGQ